MTTIALSTSEMAPHRRRTARRARPRAPPTGVLHLATKKLYVAGTGLHQALFFFAQSALRALVVYACGLRWCLRALQIRLPLRLPLALAPGALEECEAEECAASPRKKAPARIKISVDMDDGRPGPPLPEAGETSPVSPPSSPEFGATGDPDMVNMCEFMLEDRVAQAEDEEVRALASDVDKALRSGGALDPIAEGVGGSYVVHTATGFPIAVFKPEAEEVGSAGWALENALDAKACVPARGTSVLTASVREGCAPGWGARRECAAYLLDKQVPAQYRAGVPPTAYVRLRGSVGSLQRWVANDGPSEDWGPSRFDRTGARNIAMLDLRILNLDRHAANVLVRRCGNQLLQLCPIDHGYSLPEILVGEGPELAWDQWSACREPLDAGSVACLRDLAGDTALAASAACLRKLGFCEAVVRTTALATLLLYEAAKAGMTLQQIASLMRQARCRRRGPFARDEPASPSKGGRAQLLVQRAAPEKSVAEQLQLSLRRSWDVVHARERIRETIGRCLAGQREAEAAC